ncbi:MAG: 50S ribosomal protein L3 [Halanaerobiaceae bacterium]
MAKGILGKKVGMTQLFQDDGAVVPVTVIEAGPCVVVQKKTEQNDGYTSLKLGFEDVKPNKLNKPELGQFEKRGIEPKKYTKEIRDFDGDLDEGDEVTVNIFEKGEKVDISGKTKGKGFAGNIRRWNHNTGPKTHGSRFHRAPGSIGSTDAARVFKGQKLPGRMGQDNVTIKNLEIVEVDNDKNVIMVKGAVPGPKKTVLTIKNENE